MAHLKTYDQIAPIAEHLRRRFSAQEAAALVGVSNSQLRRILAKAKRDAAMPAWIAGLDIRTANILVAAGFKGREQVRQAVEQGREIPQIKEFRLGVVREWLGQ